MNKSLIQIHRINKRIPYVSSISINKQINPENRGLGKPTPVRFQAVKKKRKISGRSQTPIFIFIFKIRKTWEMK